MVVLDEAQRRVVNAPAEARLMVEAPAGSGKTEVVASRIAYLGADEGLSATAEILVLSFSRAAVHAVRTRVSEGERVEANVRTFDSFASQLLLDFDIEPLSSYDQRIRQATAALTALQDPPDLIADLAHVLIDEVQDLVGDRAEFVLAVLAHLDAHAGITVLGDPLQGIYDFVLDDSSSAMSFDAFFDALTGEFGLQRLTLEHNYRARGADCVRLANVVRGLRLETDPSCALDLLDGFEGSLPQVDQPSDWKFLQYYFGRTAVLCRSNAEVLRISRSMVDHGIRHVVRRPARSSGAARWIAPALCRLSGPIVAQSDVESALRIQLDDLNAENAWYVLKSAEGRSRNYKQIDLGRLRAKVRSAAMPIALTQGDDLEVIVSTIHRAKGLEFDNVVIVESTVGFEEEPWAQVRRRYVALSRARDSIALTRLPQARSSIREFDWLANRLQERVGRSGQTRARAIEFCPADVYSDRPSAGDEVDARAVQQILEAALPGVAVEGTLDTALSSVNHPIYTLRIDGAPIGRTADEFGHAFASLFRIKQGFWPAELVDLTLASVETTAGDPRFTEEAGLGPGGFWLVPRVVGLAKPLWDVMEEAR
ncbi:UvrD-helicase domain-containing protein [Rhodococcoides navarretei]|uniref:UvrD-helicase domain-containing protein n=1 Tax=Rhodococcus navarretei TaxID=3128981 RepID=A0ABU9CTI2_9NOCA